MDSFKDYRRRSSDFAVRRKPIDFIVLASVIGLVAWPLMSQQREFGIAPSSLPGWSETETGASQMGRAKFLEVQDIARGLGPAYNGTSCASCHNQPTIGGVGNDCEHVGLLTMSLGNIAAPAGLPCLDEVLIGRAGQSFAAPAADGLK